ncbi:MAG TPA: biotin/lipoyl-containing protein [Longimicrobiales bacterium]|nr:biotin/lipoyl-containing protein [Longimicrobiales bacterium]
MRYYVTVDGRTVVVDLAGDGPIVDGQPLAAEMSRIPGTPTRHLSVDGRSHVVVATRAARDRWDLHVDGERFEVEVVDERTRAIRAMAGQGAVASGPKSVRAPMPGLVVRVQVGPGDHVEKGRSIVIIEAMKMENDLRAESGGVVSRVLVEPGQPVEKGAVLVEFETDEAEAGG